MHKHRQSRPSFTPRHLFSLVILVAAATSGWAGIDLEVVATGLQLPVAVTAAPGLPDRVFVTEQIGRIRVITRSTLDPRPLLDITDRVSCCSDRGLLSVAFHPTFQLNGAFFVNYTDLRGDTVISRFSVSSSDQMFSDPSSESVLLRIEQPYANHNGGQLQFGPDGYLYIGTGDGGWGDDPENRAQDPLSLLGKILRIDVDAGAPYGIPATNPLRNQPFTARPEIWALGLRNPWRFSFDRVSGDLFIGDVGQDRFEEINHQAAESTGGENYGWRLMEGLECHIPPTGCSAGGLRLPILVYGHGDGNCSVTGGFVNRGRHAEFYGLYFYGDFCSGTIWGAREIDGVWRNIVTLETDLLISAFGEDSAGEMYVTHRPGAVYRIVVRPDSPRFRPARRD